jgi:hypothetical protein
MREGEVRQGGGRCRKAPSLRALHLALVLVVNAGSLWAQGVEEYRIKSVFLERFTRFIDWPDSSRVNDPAAPFVIGVIGGNPFGRILDQDYGGHRIKGKEVEVRYFHSLGQVDKCDLLFVAGSEKSRLAAIRERLEDSGVLIVGDVERFVHAGAHIAFYEEGGRVRFAINIDSAREAGFEIASLLLDYARVVGGTEGQ